MLTKKRTVCVDFDGVLHTYPKGSWRGVGVVNGSMVPSSAKALQHLSGTYKIVILTCRADCSEGIEAVSRALESWGIPFDEVTNRKPIAEFYIDDRAIRFVSWVQVLRTIDRENNSMKY